MVATIAPQLLEIPLILACFGFSTALLGISGADIRIFHDVRGAMADSNFADFVTLEDNNWLIIQLVLVIVSALTFFFSALGLVLAGRQFGGRRGEYTGKGTSAWILMGLIFLALSGLLAGSAGAVTAFAVTRKPSFSAGSGYSEPFDLAQQLYLRQIIQDLTKGVAGSLTLLQSGGASSVDSSYLGIWDVSTLAEANDNIVRYLNESTRWKAEVIVTWFTLGPVFLTMVVHFALPFVWKWLGLIRTESPKTRKKYYYENKQYSYNDRSSSYNEKPSNYNERPSRYNDRSSNYNERSSNYIDRSTNYIDRPSSYGDRASSYNDRPSSYGNKQYGYNNA